MSVSWLFLKIFGKTFGKSFSWLHQKVYFSLKNWQKSVHWNICCHQKKLEMVEKWLHISCKRFSRYILTKIAKIGKFALYSFIYLQVVPAFNGAVQVKRNIIKPTFISFPVKSWGSDLTPLATHTFIRSYKISHPPQLQASSSVFIALQPCRKLGIILENEVFQKLKGSCTGRWNVWGRWFLAGNQGSHQNFVPSLISKNLWQIFIEMKKKKKI